MTPAIEAVPLTAIEKNVLTTADFAASITVTNSEQYTEACDFVRAIAKTKKEVEDTFGPIKKKQHEAWKEACAQEAKYLGPLDKALMLVKGKIGTFTAQEEKKRREEEQRQRELARKEAEALALQQATELERQGENVAAEQVIEQAVAAPAPVVVIPKTIPKQEGISTRKTWKFRIVDTAKIPREYMTVDEVKIGQIVRAMKELSNIPGVEVYAEDTVSVR